jgi:UDP-GlcNAc:undecaprenyl-phosphate GlcNAc-1-phosphate transferase
MISPILFYGQPFVLGFGIASVLCFLFIKLFKIFPLSNKRKSKRHIHKNNISRFGGVTIITAFISTLLYNEYIFFDNIVWSLIVGGIVILFFGIIDDIKPLSWQTQIFSQVAIVLLIFIMGVRTEFITNPFGDVIWLVHDSTPIWSLLFMLIWMLVIMNAVNWSDGIDGLAGGIVLIAAVTLFVISLQPNVMQPPIAIITIILAGSVLGFLIFNLPPAKIFAGSSGAFFMGYAIALLAIAAGAKIGTTLLVLAVPLVDAIWVVWHRIRSGKSIFRSDKQHLHHRLLDRGWSVRQILMLYYSVTIFSAGIAIATQTIGKLIALIIFCIMIIIFFLFLSYDTNKKQNYI